MHSFFIVVIIDYDVVVEVSDDLIFGHMFTILRYK